MWFARLIGIVGILILIVSVLAGCNTTTTSNKESLKKVSASGSIKKVTEMPGELATVTGVVDGDTIDVRFENGRTERVRYIGINSLEFSGWQRVGHGTWANRLLVEGKKVKLVQDVSERDKHDILLRYVYVGDIFVNARLLDDGHAFAQNEPPNSTYATEFAELEKKAKALGRGCWIEPSGSSDGPHGD